MKDRRHIKCPLQHRRIRVCALIGKTNRIHANLNLRTLITFDCEIRTSTLIILKKINDKSLITNP